jgi:hypothetical protein
MLLLLSLCFSMLTTLFDAGDTNGDGVVDEDEFSSIVRYVAPTMQHEEVRLHWHSRLWVLCGV